jgi:hypothetical protein
MNRLIIVLLLAGCAGQQSPSTYPDTPEYRRCIYKVDLAMASRPAPSGRLSDRLEDGLRFQELYESLVLRCVRGDDRS